MKFLYSSLHHIIRIHVFTISVINSIIPSYKNHIKVNIIFYKFNIKMSHVKKIYLNIKFKY